MSGRRAKRLRREAEANGTANKPKRYFKPWTIPLPSGKVDPETGEEEMIATYIPRRQRRAAFRAMMADVRKGRLRGRNQ